MGLAEVKRSMTTSVTIPTSGSRNQPSSSSTSSTTPTSSTSPDQVVRKKRTFDIAFLTGQTEKEGNNNSFSLDRTSPLNSKGSAKNNNNVIESKCAIFHHQSHGYTPHDRLGEDVQEQDGTNSDSSSIDVMTNGSLSESESQSHSPLSSISEQPSPPLHPVVLIHHQHHHQLSRSNGHSSNGGGGGISQNRSSSNNSAHGRHHHQHPQHDIKSNGGGNKSRNNRSPVKEKIRFESRRTIDINHTVDSLKIKENVQFSTLLPSSSMGLNLSSNNNGSGPISTSSSSSMGSSSKTLSGATDLTLPHLASTIALLPHVARFPLGLSHSGMMFPGAGHHPHHHMAAAAAAAAAAAGNLPFHAKMEKSESINISYPKARGGGGSHFPDPYAAAALAAAGGYPYPNILAGLAPHQPSFPNPLGSPPGSGGCTGGGSSSLPTGNGGGGSGQQVSPQSAQQPPQHSPSQVSSCGLGLSATLLPPSLTSLTLPAQNVCAKCNIGFRMTSDLVYHMRSHHKRDTDPVKRQREEKLKCPVCHETFRERHHLTRHMTAHQDRAEEK